MSDDKAQNSHNPELEHRHGEGYSGRKKIPTVQKFNEEERQKREEARRQEAVSIKKGLSRVVRDPVTGGRVQIQDSHGDYEKATNDMLITVPRRNVSSDSRESYRATEFNSEGAYLSEIKNDPKSDQHEHRFGKFIDQIGSEAQKMHRTSSQRSSRSARQGSGSRMKDDKEEQRKDKNQAAADDRDGWVDIPMRGQRSNILFYTMPNPDFDQHHENVVNWFMRFPYFVFFCECFRYFVIDFGRITSILLCLAAGYWIKEQMEISWSSSKLDAVKTRADQALAKRVPESVEWLNAVIEAVWKQINPDIFIPAMDKLEDIMQASAPSIIHAVKVDDIGHGDHAVRLLSMRYLEDKEIAADEDHDSNDQSAGDFVNVEVTVAYSAKMSLSDAAAKVKNMHLLIIFYGGLANVLGVPVPIFTEVQGFIATLRLRLQFTPEFPYIKNTTFSLMGLPNFDISVKPLSSRLINITNLPIVSKFVKQSIKAAFNEYNAPKSYTIDLGSLLVGDGIPYETLAIGVIVVHLRRAQNLEAQDKGGLSDPYIVVAMSNYGKPIFSSRIIEKTLNPVFEETCFVLVTPEALRSKERLSLQLWDSDQVSADDENGRVEFDIQDLVANAGELDEREDGLVSSIEGKSMSGSLNWSVGYFSKRQCNKDLATDGSDPNLSDNVKELQDVAGRRALPDIETSKACAYCSPDPAWVSGILRVQIHLATDLYANSPHGSWQAKMHYKEGQDTSSPEIEADEARSPNAYCNIMLNDQLIYRTRTKPFSNKPYFNAGTERFVRDWSTAVCLVAVYDKRTREHDALLGVIPLKLSEVFQNASQVSKTYPLIGGVGEGKLKISLLWESVEHKLPKSLLGWDIGNFQIISSRLTMRDTAKDEHNLKNMKLKIFSSAAATSISGRHCHTKEGISSWTTNSNKEEPLKLPCIRRHSSAICIEFYSTTRMTTYAIATYWLTDMLDDEPQTLQVKIWRTDTDERRCLVRQNRVQDEDERQGLQYLGILEFKAVFLRGLGGCDESHVRTDTSLQQAHEAWQAATAYARRNADNSHLVGKKHENSTGLVAPDPYAKLNENVLSAQQSSTKAAHSSDINGTDGEEHRRTSSKPSGTAQDFQGIIDSSEQRRHTSTTYLNDQSAPRGSMSASRNNMRHSVIFSDFSQSSTEVQSQEKSNGSETEVDRNSHKYKTMQKQKAHREQRGSQQFKTFRTLKWAKDGLVTSKEKLMQKVGRKHMRRPDVESEV